MRVVFATIIALCSFLYPQANVAVAQEAPAWLTGEYVATIRLPNGTITTFIQIKSGTIGADGQLALDLQYRNDRNLPNWTPVQYEAKLVSPERVDIAFTTPRGSKFDLVAKPDGSLSGTAANAARSGDVRFTKSK